jgi:hypothetical protein
LKSTVNPVVPNFHSAAFNPFHALSANIVIVSPSLAAAHAASNVVYSTFHIFATTPTNFSFHSPSASHLYHAGAS